MKTIFVPMVMERLERSALEAAMALAREHEAKVDALVGLSAVSPLASGWDYVPATPYDTVSEATKAAAEAMADDAREMLADTRCAVRIASSFWLTPYEQVLAEGARTTDLIVLGRRPEPSDADDRLFAALLLGAGRPVLVVPDGAWREAGFRRIAIAWRPTAESARAVHDAIPLLQKAQAAQIVRVQNADADPGTLAAADDALLDDLSQHGIPAGLHCLTDPPSSKGESILAFADAMHADLIVAGGYGHSRLLEQMLGGVTRTLLHRSPLPVFFSH